MSILNVEHLSHGFGDRAIFHDVSFRLLKGEHIGLIGANGEGKSTFMNIITGRLQPDEGKVEWSKNVRAGYLDQHTALEKGMTIRQVLTSAFDFLLDMEQELNGIYEKMGEADEDTMQQLMEDAGTLQELLTAHDFYMIDSKVEEVGRALGLSEIGLDKDVSELSGGQRTKVLLGKLLLEKPDILLLDEPTNYLDVSHIEWLKRYLNDYENAFILISHDIPFLNSVVNLIYHMDNQQLTRYVGDYDKFQEVYAMKKAQLEAAYNKQQKEIADLKDFVARNKARVSTRNMAMSRQKKLDKMDVIELQAEKPKPEFNFKEARTPGRYIFQTSDLVIGYDEPLSSPLNLSMERGSKIVITGANGIGKTTLLKSILGLIDPLSGSVEQGDYLEIGYFEQEMSQDISTTCIEEIWKEFPGYSQYEVRSALAKCGLTTKHIESLVKVLSGGEQAKVRLCKLINRPSNVLVLDEPTNHLDVDAKDELKRALIAYRGSILMVCHEPEFYDGLADTVWDASKWTTRTVLQTDSTTRNMITWLSAVQHSKRQPRQENFPDAAAIFFKLPDKVLLTGKSIPFLFVIFVFEQRTYKRYRSKFLRVTSDNVIDIISHNQRICIVAHRVRMKAQPERFTHFCIVYGRMRSHIQQVSKLKHIAQFGEFACDITDIVITCFPAQLRSYNKNTRVRLYCFKFGNDFAHITEKRIVIILRTIDVDVLDTSQRMPEHKRIVVA